MKTTHIEEKRNTLTEKREQLLARFDKAARKRKNLARLSTEIQSVNEFLSSLDRIEEETRSQAREWSPEVCREFTVPTREL